MDRIDGNSDLVSGNLKSLLAKASAIDYAKILLGIGILLRGVQFFINQGLREDEGHLIINLVNRNISDILKPLEHIQVAPPLFLFIEKVNLIVFGQNEFSVRYLAVLSSCLSLILFYHFLKAHTNSYITTLGVGLMALNRHLIFYAVAVKQYSSDLLIHLLLISILFSKQERLRQNKYFLLGLVGVISIWLSHTSLFVLVAISVYWLFSFKVLAKSQRIKILAIWVCWAISFIGLYFATIANNPNQGPMASYWSEHFMPLFPHNLHQFGWFLTHFRDMVSFSLGFSNKHFILWIPFGVSFFVGIFYFTTRKEYTFLFLLVPLVIHLLVSGFSRYPFYHRLILYETFPLFLFISAGLFFVIHAVTQFSPFKKITAIAIAGILTLQLVITLTNFPYPTEDMKKDLVILKSNFKEGDKIYVYYPVDGVFDFYKEKYVPKGTSIVYGSESRADFSKYEEQISPLKGRVWFVFSHLYTNPSGLSEDDFIIQSARRRGEVLLSGKSYSASIYLMDLH